MVLQEEQFLAQYQDEVDQYEKHLKVQKATNATLREEVQELISRVCAAREVSGKWRGPDRAPFASCLRAAASLALCRCSRWRPSCTRSGGRCRQCAARQRRTSSGVNPRRRVSRTRRWTKRNAAC